MEPTTLKHKIDNSNKNSTDKEDNDIMTMIVNIIEVTMTQASSEDYLLNENDDREDRHPYDLTSTNSI